VWCICYLTLGGGKGQVWFLCIIYLYITPKCFSNKSMNHSKGRSIKPALMCLSEVYGNNPNLSCSLTLLFNTQNFYEKDVEWAIDGLSRMLLLKPCSADKQHQYDLIACQNAESQDPSQTVESCIWTDPRRCACMGALEKLNLGTYLPSMSTIFKFSAF
jgi:hypothetical protein